MNKWRKLAAMMTFSFSVLTLTPSSLAAPTTLDQVAAVVNNSVVLEGDVNRMLQTIKQNAARQNQPLPDDVALRPQIIERLIMDELILQQAKKMNIQVTEQQIDQEIMGIAAENKITLEQLRNSLTSSGIRYSSYRDQLRKDMILSEVRNNEVRRRISILPQEVESLAKQLATQRSNNIEINLSHILIALPENPTQNETNQAEKLAKSLVDQLNKGANFAKLAASYSADSFALQGGQMGWGKPAEFPTLFAEQLQYPQKNQIVGPIRSGVGFHILKVNDIRGETNTKVSATEVKSRHILVRTSILLSDVQAKEKLENMVSEINSGKATFEQLAKANSEDPGSAANGGDLGWMLPERFDPAFANALMQLSKGQISAPVKSMYGWHIIQLLDTRQVDKTDDALKDRAYRMVFNRKFSEEAQSWLQELRATAYIKILDNSNNE